MKKEEIMDIGRKLYEEGNFEKAKEYFEKASELGDAVATYNLACLYENGDGKILIEI